MEKRKRNVKKSFSSGSPKGRSFCRECKGGRNSGKEGRGSMKGKKIRFEYRFSSLANREIRI